MSKKRRKFSLEFKKKVVLEALKRASNDISISKEVQHMTLSLNFSIKLF